VLMLRGAQTPGELKTRTERQHRFAGMDELGETLERLIERQLVVRLERRPGQREERYRHLLGGGEAPDGEAESTTAAVPARATPDGVEQRLERLEGEVAELRAELQALREQQSG
jgi:uncharacterized protein